MKLMQQSCIAAFQTYQEGSVCKIEAIREFRRFETAERLAASLHHTLGCVVISLYQTFSVHTDTHTQPCQAFQRWFVSVGRMILISGFAQRRADKANYAALGRFQASVTMGEVTLNAPRLHRPHQSQ
jgi:hypothetical protein